MGYGHENSARGGNHLTEQLLSIARSAACEKESALACVSGAPHLPSLSAPLGSPLLLG